MMLAQQLYEGIALEKRTPVGLITYMRTDSVHLASVAVAEIRNYIGEVYGDAYLPKSQTYTAAVRMPRRPMKPSVRPRSCVPPMRLRPILNGISCGFTA